VRPTVRIADRGVIVDASQETVVNLLSTEFSSYAQGPVDKIDESHRMLWLGFFGQRIIAVGRLEGCSKPARLGWRLRNLRRIQEGDLIQQALLLCDCADGVVLGGVILLLSSSEVKAMLEGGNPGMVKEFA
jgi:hypothetical protein